MKSLYCLLALLPLLASASDEVATLFSPAFACKLESLTAYSCRETYVRDSTVFIRPRYDRGVVFYHVSMRAALFHQSSFYNATIKSNEPGVYLITTSETSRQNKFIEIDLRSGKGTFFLKPRMKYIYTDARLSDCRILEGDERATFERQHFSPPYPETAVMAQASCISDY